MTFGDQLHAEDLKNELKNSGKTPVYTVELFNTYYIYNISISAVGASVDAIGPSGLLSVDIEDNPGFTLDYYLDEIYALCNDNAWEQYAKEYAATL